jgi:hypothetical protein
MSERYKGFDLVQIKDTKIPKKIVFMQTPKPVKTHDKLGILDTIKETQHEKTGSPAK